MENLANSCPQTRGHRFKSCPRYCQRALTSGNAGQGPLMWERPACAPPENPSNFVRRFPGQPKEPETGDGSRWPALFGGSEDADIAGGFRALTIPMRLAQVARPFGSGTVSMAPRDLLTWQRLAPGARPIPGPRLGTTSPGSLQLASEIFHRAGRTAEGTVALAVARSVKS